MKYYVHILAPRDVTLISLIPWHSGFLFFWKSPIETASTIDVQSCILQANQTAEMMYLHLLYCYGKWYLQLSKPCNPFWCFHCILYYYIGVCTRTSIAYCLVVGPWFLAEERIPKLGGYIVLPTSYKYTHILWSIQCGAIYQQRYSSTHRTTWLQKQNRCKESLQPKSLKVNIRITVPASIKIA